MKKCPTCKGSQVVYLHQYNPPQQVTCHTCEGRGRVPRGKGEPKPHCIVDMGQDCSCPTCMARLAGNCNA